MALMNSSKHFDRDHYSTSLLHESSVFLRSTCANTHTGNHNALDIGGTFIVI